MAITISVNLEEFRQQVGYLGRTQLPFATALALSRCADTAVATSKASLSSKFIVRNNWIAKGFRTERATKEKLIATVSHLDPFMALQEFGGEKSPLNARDVAIPVGARSTPSALTPQSKWPGKLSRHFYITKGGNLLEFQRTGRKSKGARAKRHVDRRAGPRPLDPNLKLMYVFRTSVRITPRLGLVETCRKVMAEDFGANFTGFLEFALKTAK
ncbi:MAG: hypothetical protein H0U66_03195 [Gemmatimonadaceae bacterium]|nr:hypothetical protein [Gemmatimonadaceae bacterium]